MLTEFPKNNWIDIKEWKLLYTQFPKHLLHKYENFWFWRFKICRMLQSPVESKRYCLCLLLTHVTGLISFEHLQTTKDGKLCSCLNKAAKKMGYSSQRHQIEDCFSEATFHQMPNALLHLFAIVLIYCQQKHSLCYGKLLHFSFKRI